MELLFFFFFFLLADDLCIFVFLILFLGTTKNDLWCLLSEVQPDQLLLSVEKSVSGPRVRLPSILWVLFRFLAFRDRR